MSKKVRSIPVKPLAQHFDKGIAVGKVLSGNLRSFEEAGDSHRHDFHFFLIQEKGVSHSEIDFEKYQLNKPSVLYIHPDQVHRILKVEKAIFYLLAISNDNLHRRYLKLLNEIAPAKPLPIKGEDFSVIIKAITLCIELFERKDERLYQSVLKDCCNTLVALIISKYVEQLQPTAALSRFETVSKAFKTALEQNFIETKSPSAYARFLHISTPYLNECVRHVTGFPVSYHIQQRVILEAKRLLYHSARSVKEIAAELGYEDHAYFSRLFTKVAGMSALAFRNKNLD
jgi:AraC-like DNA-binding protein